MDIKPELEILVGDLAIVDPTSHIAVVEASSKPSEG